VPSNAVVAIVADLLAKPLTSRPTRRSSDPKASVGGRRQRAHRSPGKFEDVGPERITQLEERPRRRRKDTEEGRTGPVKPLVIPPTFEGKEEKARTELAASYAGRFTRMADMESLEPAEKFINAVASVYDPHTLYMPPAEKENFVIQISGWLEGIGAALGEEDHYIVVRDLIRRVAGPGKLESASDLGSRPAGQRPDRRHRQPT
jgi:hypothetical protein